MSLDPTTSPPKSRRTKLLWLVAAHVTVVAAGALATRGGHGPSEMLNAIFLGIVFSQVSLLGLWAGSAANSWYVRLVGVAAGNGYFLVLGWISSQGNMLHDLMCLTACTLIMASVLLIARCFRVRISLPTCPVSAACRIQFSIRDLMVLTLVVACVVGFGRWLPSYRPSLFDLEISALIYLPFVVIGLLSVWPALSARRPLLPCSIFVVIAGGAGMYFKFFGPHIDTAFWITITSVEALSLVASLLVVRSCGYRLVRLPAANSGNRDGAARPAATP